MDKILNAEAQNEISKRYPSLLGSVTQVDNTFAWILETMIQHQVPISRFSEVITIGLAVVLRTKYERKL